MRLRAILFCVALVFGLSVSASAQVTGTATHSASSGSETYSATITITDTTTQALRDARRISFNWTATIVKSYAGQSNGRTVSAMYAPENSSKTGFLSYQPGLSSNNNSSFNTTNTGTYTTPSSNPYPVGSEYVDVRLLCSITSLGSELVTVRIPLTGDQPQTVTLTPSTANVLSGQYVQFTASGGHNDYQWIVTGGGVTKSGDSFLVRGGSVGSFSLTVWSPAGNGYARSNDATSIFTVQESFNKSINLPKNEGSRPVQYVVMQNGEAVGEYIQQPGQAARIVNVVTESDAPLTVISRVVGIVQDENGVWIVDPNNNSPDTVSDPINPDSSEDEPGETVTLTGPNAPNPGMPNNDNAPVWNTPTPNGDPSGQVDLLTNSVFREGINHIAEDLGAIREFNETSAALEEEKQQALTEYLDAADSRVAEKYGSWSDTAKAAVVAEFEAQWSSEIGETPAFSAHNVSVPGSGAAWPQFTLPGLGTVVLSPYRLPWMITVLNVVREIILWLLVYGFIRFGIEKATDYSLQVATVPNVTTTQDLLADAVPVVAEKVQWIKQGLTALGLIVTLIVMFGAAVGLISTGMWSILSGASPSIFSFISSAGSSFSSMLSGASSPLWGFIAEFFPLGAFITLLVAEVLLIAFMAPVFLLASVVVRTLRA